ncbi:hypothetical protein ACJZL1_06420 [Wolbachia endosymbiont of Rhagoletis indifferens]|uniref:hypothetical protein n=1 Tax=Wolbachia endosymbiont of Rhagoletis indifferens TaxID=3383250 RepID=UPI003AF3760C
MSGCHPSALTHSCTNVFGLTHQWVSFQCLTLEWLCCIATEKIWWLLTKFIINNHLTVEEKICHRK